MKEKLLGDLEHSEDPVPDYVPYSVNKYRKAALERMTREEEAKVAKENRAARAATIRGPKKTKAQKLIAQVKQSSAPLREMAKSYMEKRKKKYRAVPWRQ